MILPFHMAFVIFSKKKHYEKKKTECAFLEISILDLFGQILVLDLFILAAFRVIAKKMKPTLESVSVETSRDALVLITAVMEGILDPVSSRPDRKEEWNVKHGDVYVFNQSRYVIYRYIII